MKTLGHFLPKAAPLAVAASLVLFSGKTFASGPAGGVNGAPASSSTVGVSGTGRGGGSVAGPAASGARSGVSFSNNGVRPGSASVRGTGAPSGLPLPYRNTLSGGSSPATPRFSAAPNVARPGNAWSGAAVGPANGATRRPTRPSNQNAWTDNRFTGQSLDPGAPGSNLPTRNQGNPGGHGFRNRGGYHYRLPGRYYYYPYACGPVYAPYISDYGGGYYGGAYPYSNDVPSADVEFGVGNATTVSPQYVEQAPANANEQPESAPQTNPAPRRQEPPDANRGTIPSNGPDSLVEAVQEELIRRGYFGGKVDAMFNADTKEALRKFQTDHHLAASGLINEATLHALQLD